MPCRARGQLLALDKHAVGPALLSQMVERGNADHAPANHHCPRVGSHSFPRELRGRQLAIPRQPDASSYDSITIEGERQSCTSLESQPCLASLLLAQRMRT